ncbi:unnamed protein product [Effrenium voratum]|nr:unnamed protein product [Effrenium voratum]
MGQTAGSLPLKRFVNSPGEIVAEALEGYLWTHPNVQLLEGYPEVKVLVSSTWQQNCGRVAVLSGGGSGHEPADAGMIGDGLLTAVVCGEIFASPSAFAVARALEAVTGKAGALVVIRSNAGTRLNFMSAVKEVQSRAQLNVRVVCVSDDVATSKRLGDKADFRQARGIAGSLLVCKIAGAAAAAGLSLDEVCEEAEAAAAAVRSQGVSFNACSIPGMLPARPIPADEMEVGLGIHGEPGLRVKATASTSAKEIVETIMSQLAKHVPRKVPLCVMLNNLGSVPQIEMQLIAGQVMNTELGPRIKLLIGPSHLMTALDTNGISISVLPLEDRHRKCGTAQALDKQRDGDTLDGAVRTTTVHFREPEAPTARTTERCETVESLAFFSQASEESPPNSMNGKQSSHVPRMESFTETEVLEPPEGKESFRCPRKVSFAETETPMERQVSSQSYPRMVSFTETEMMEPESMEDDLSFGMSDSEDPEHLELFPSNFSFLCELRAIGAWRQKHNGMLQRSDHTATWANTAAS